MLRVTGAGSACGCCAEAVADAIAEAQLVLVEQAGLQNYLAQQMHEEEA